MIFQLLIVVAAISGNTTVVDRQLVIQRPSQVRYLVGNPYYDFQRDRDERIAKAVIDRLVESGVIKRPLERTLHEQQCSDCHQGKADAPDWQAELTAPQITKALRAISSGRMPKGRNLTVSQKNYLLESLLHSEKGTKKWSKQLSPQPLSRPDVSSPPVPAPPTSASDEEPTSTYK